MAAVGTARVGARRLAEPSTTIGMLLAATFMGTVSNNIVNVPLRVIATGLHVPVQSGVLVVSGFVLMLAVGMPLSGWVGDRFGRRRTLVVALGAMAAGTVGAALSPSLPVLVVFRAVQGLACAAIPPSVMAMLSTIYPATQRARLMSGWAAANGVGQAVGPPLGGALASLLGWRAIFWVLAPVTALVMLGCRAAVPADSGKPLRLHLSSATFLTAGATLLITAATLISQPAVPAVVTAAMGVAGALLVAAFVVVSLRAASPLIDPRLVIEARFLRSGVAAFCQMFCLGVLVVAVPLYVTGPLGRNPAVTGILVFVLPAMMALGSPVAGLLCDRFHPRMVLRSGLLVLAAAGVALGWYVRAGGTSLAVLIVVLAVSGAGVSLVQTPSATGATRSVAGRSGAALGLFNMLRFAGSALGAAWVAIVYPRGWLLVLFAGVAAMAFAGLAVNVVTRGRPAAA